MAPGTSWRSPSHRIESTYVEPTRYRGKCWDLSMNIHTLDVHDHHKFYLFVQIILGRRMVSLRTCNWITHAWSRQQHDPFLGLQVLRKKCINPCRPLDGYVCKMWFLSLAHEWEWAFTQYTNPLCICIWYMNAHVCVCTGSYNALNTFMFEHSMQRRCHLFIPYWTTKLLQQWPMTYHDEACHDCLQPRGSCK